MHIGEMKLMFMWFFVTVVIQTVHLSSGMQVQRVVTLIPLYARF